MCNPMLALGTALSVGGGALRGANNASYVKAQQEVEKAAYMRSKAAREAEIGRQKTFETQANDNWMDANAALSADNYQDKQDTSVQDFLATVDDRPSTVVPEGFLLSGQEGASSVVSTEIAARAAKAAQEARARVEALAKLSSYDTAALDRKLTLSGNADSLSTINNLRRGSLGVSQAEQTIAPRQVFPNDNMFADILSGAGGALSGASWSY